MKNSTLPPNINALDRVILFDGVCKLCNAWCNFIIRHDKQQLFKLCSVQSDEGKKILSHFNLPTNSYETMLYVEGNQCFKQSDAFFKIIAQIGFPWKLACIFWIIPKSIRNWMYDRIALNRYRIFGKYNYCTLPSPDHKDRFLSE